MNRKTESMPTNAWPDRAPWGGHVVTAIVTIFFFAIAIANLFYPAIFAEANGRTGLPMNLSFLIGMIALSCATLYAVPCTAIIGAILITGFLGGAIAINLRAGSSLFASEAMTCMAVGLLTWGGIYLREAHVRAVLPVHRRHARKDAATR